ncbi:LysR family transcriptional regulator [Thalassomonas actiniarum]|uniref:LysR family transcriptional regulator n=1 Tax=Thalassomonas actiniarum TaxID=485447 RepID=A0AAE9YY88_9GAMM|nr:LysR family transcriptional regulator [Thalassomonas actiniarum]WDE02630.1 LysR family transcriptional regulator [Thalassomonas actiniarum]
MYAQLPPLNSIRVFDAAARLGSFKKAAEELHVTPTAVSHQIKALEEALGTLLFVRKTRAIQLTRDGKLLAETAYSVLQQLTNTVSEIAKAKNSITVSTTSSFAAMWLVPNLGKFNQLHPSIEVAVKTGEQVDDLDKDRSIDLAIRYGVYDDTLANASCLVTEKVGMYATPSYVESIADGQVANLLEARWQNSNLPQFTWHALLKGSPRDKSRYKVSQFSQEHHIIQAALAGQGIALVSTLLVKNALAQGWLTQYNYVEKAQQQQGLSYYLLVPEHNTHSHSIVKFKHWLLEALR